MTKRWSVSVFPWTTKRRNLKVIIGLCGLLGTVLLFNTGCYIYQSDSGVAVELEPPPSSSRSSRYPKTILGEGFVMALRFWDQTTQASAHLIQLQCWARTNKLLAVEPFLDNTYLSTMFDTTSSKGMLLLQDVFDMDAWANMSIQSGIPPLVSMERLLLESLHYKKNVILVQIFYPSRHTHDPEAVVCDFNWERALAGMERLRLLRVVRSVCFSSNVPGASAEFFNRAIFGKFSPEDALVIINEWRGIGHNRVRIDLPCSAAKSFTCQKPLSRKVTRDAEVYANTYLGGVGNYLAIMARFERTTPKYWHANKTTLRQGISDSIDASLKEWSEIKAQTSLSTTFLAFDYGAFGSHSFKEVYKYHYSKDLLEGFHHTIYGNNGLSITEWEQSFVKTSSINNSAYIAALQLQVVVQAKCIILVGQNSNFLEYAFRLYTRNHPHNLCVKVIGTLDAFGCKNTMHLNYRTPRRRNP